MEEKYEFTAMSRESFPCQNFRKSCVREQGAEENIWIEMDVVTGGYRKLHNEVLHNLYKYYNSINTNRSYFITCTLCQM
jgi:hypothetical protein